MHPHVFPRPIEVAIPISTDDANQVEGRATLDAMVIDSTNDSDDTNVITPRATGRPTKKSISVLTTITSAVASGLPLKDAARLAGIDVATLRRWRHDDPDVDQAVKTAKAVMVARNIERIQQAAGTDWKASAWLLERRAPEQFGKRSVVEVEAAVEHPLTGENIEPVDSAERV